MRYLLLILALASSAHAAPILHSNPLATNTAYLDFDGEPAERWDWFAVPQTPAYTGDASTVWSVVAEKFKGFDVDITTEPTPPAPNVMRVVIGGGGAWTGNNSISGISEIGSYLTLLDNVVYVFSNILGSPQDVGLIASHELGHAYGCFHQSVWQGGLKFDEYAPGVLMGNPLGHPDATWATGLNSEGEFQVDSDKLSSALSPEPSALCVLGLMMLSLRSRRQSGPRPSSSGTSRMESIRANSLDCTALAAASRSVAVTYAEPESSSRVKESRLCPLTRKRMTGTVHISGGN